MLSNENKNKLDKTSIPFNSSESQMEEADVDDGTNGQTSTKQKNLRRIHKEHKQNLDNNLNETYHQKRKAEEEFYNNQNYYYPRDNFKHNEGSLNVAGKAVKSIYEIDEKRFQLNKQETKLKLLNLRENIDEIVDDLVNEEEEIPTDAYLEKPKEIDIKAIKAKDGKTNELFHNISTIIKSKNKGIVGLISEKHSLDKDEGHPENNSKTDILKDIKNGTDLIELSVEISDGISNVSSGYIDEYTGLDEFGRYGTALTEFTKASKKKCQPEENLDGFSKILQKHVAQIRQAIQRHKTRTGLFSNLGLSVRAIFSKKASNKLALWRVAKKVAKEFKNLDVTNKEEMSRAQNRFQDWQAIVEECGPYFEKDRKRNAHLDNALAEIVKITFNMQTKTQKLFHDLQDNLNDIKHYNEEYLENILKEEPIPENSAYFSDPEREVFITNLVKTTEEIKVAKRQAIPKNAYLNIYEAMEHVYKAFKENNAHIAQAGIEEKENIEEKLKEFKENATEYVETIEETKVDLVHKSQLLAEGIKYIKEKGAQIKENIGDSAEKCQGLEHNAVALISLWRLCKSYLLTNDYQVAKPIQELSIFRAKKAAINFMVSTVSQGMFPDLDTFVIKMKDVDQKTATEKQTDLQQVSKLLKENGKTPEFQAKMNKATEDVSKFVTEKVEGLTRLFSTNKVQLNQQAIGQEREARALKNYIKEDKRKDKDDRRHRRRVRFNNRPSSESSISF